ncbi:MAG: TPR end-of-group domain-containing protein [Gemmatimonadota bacterium]
MAAVLAHLGRKEEALSTLRAAYARGMRYGAGIHSDRDFEPLWNDPGFRAMLEPRG